MSRDSSRVFKVVFICEGTRERQAWWVSTEAKARHAVWCHTHDLRGKLQPIYRQHDYKVIIKEMFKAQNWG